MCFGFNTSKGALLKAVCQRLSILFGQGEIVTDADAKWAALEAITEHVLPGRWADARRPTAKEMQATTVVAMAIESASAKTRSGPPGDDEEDYALPVWAGVLPLQVQALPLEADPRLRAGIEVPDYVAHYQARVNE